MIIGCQIHSCLIFSSGPIWEPTTHLRSDRLHVQEHDDWQRKPMCHYKVCGAHMIHATWFNMDLMFFLWLATFKPKPTFTSRPHLQIKPLEKKYQEIHMTRFWFNIQRNPFLHTFPVLRKQSVTIHCLTAPDESCAILCIFKPPQSFCRDPHFSISVISWYHFLLSSVPLSLLAVPSLVCHTHKSLCSSGHHS